MEAHFGRADAAGVNYSKAVYDAVVQTSMKNGKLTLELASEVPGIELFYSTDDTMPDRFSTKYTQPVPLPDGPITLRVVGYRNRQPIGHLITLSRAELQRRVGR